MTEQPHGRYFAEELVLGEGADARGRIQHFLDAGERKKWRRVVLFWDTIRPSFGRTPE